MRQIARFSRWLEADGLSVTDVSQARAEQFMAWQRLDGRYRSHWSRPGLQCLVDVLRELGVLAAEGLAVPSTPTDVLLDRFERYLVAERGLAAGTVALYSASVRRFAEGLPPERELSGLVVGDVTAAVLRESERVSVSATQSFVNGVRAFLRFCFVEGLVGSDLSQAALLVRGRSSSSLPRGISSADARALLCSCDRRQALGRRDYAIIITLMRLGLRRSELAGLCCAPLSLSMLVLLWVGMEGWGTKEEVSRSLGRDRGPELRGAAAGGDLGGGRPAGGLEGA